MNKPTGCTSMRGIIGKRTSYIKSVYDYFPENYPLLPHVGRLDENSEGLLLFTDDHYLHGKLINGDSDAKVMKGLYNYIF